MRSGLFATVLTLFAACATDAFVVRDGVASQSWMYTINDTMPLCDLVLPGTHDAAAYDIGIPVGRSLVVTQTSNITEQLERGIRYVDFRVGICASTTDKLCMFHGEVYLRLNFDTALEMVREFLAYHPSETVVMRLEHEHGGGLDDFQEFVESNYLSKAPGLWLQHKAKKAVDVTLGDARGKIVLFWNSGAKTSNVGFDYQLVDTRETWEFDSVDDMSDAFEKRAQASNVAGWYENPTSGLVYFTVFGQRWFSPDAIDKTAKAMLPRVTKLAATTPMKKGIVSMDYPTDELIGTLIGASLDQRPPRRHH